MLDRLIVAAVVVVSVLTGPVRGGVAYDAAYASGKEMREAGKLDAAREAFGKAVELGRTADERTNAQLALGHVWLAEGEFARARAAYEKAKAFPARDQTHLRARIGIDIADSYMKEQRVEEAIAEYEKALQIGPGGWRLDFARNELAKARELRTQRTASGRTAAGLSGSTAGGGEQPAPDDRVVNVHRFAREARDGDWSRAIQAAVDFVHASNGYDHGGTVLLPAGTYRVDESIVVGGNPAHWGIRIVGYGATLVGSKTLDGQGLSDPEPEAEDKGVPVLVLRDPPGTEGASYCIEGIRLTREQRGQGVGVSVPWKDVPKNICFRNVKIHGQKVGVHVKYSWQLSFQDCLFRGNQIGMLLQSHGNHVGIVNCAFRRQDLHGLVIGPDRGEWGSNAHHISGSIFEANKGYGICLHSAAQTVITGNYFEANGNHVGVFTPYGEVTIDTNLFWGSYGHGWRRNPYSDDANVVLAGTRKVQLRNNKYARATALFRRKEGEVRWEYVPNPEGPSGVPEDRVKKPEHEPGYEYVERDSGIFVAGGLGEGMVFDALPVVLQGALKDVLRAGSDTGLTYYEYDPASNTFSAKSLLDRVAQ